MVPLFVDGRLDRAACGPGAGLALRARHRSSKRGGTRRGAVAGLGVQQQGGPGAFANIRTRGLRNEDTAVLVDGLRFREVGAPQGDASGFLADLILTDVDRLEVLRGTGSSLYGSNAIGG